MKNADGILTSEMERICNIFNDGFINTGRTQSDNISVLQNPLHFR